MKNVASFPNAKGLAYKLLQVFSQLAGNTVSEQPMGESKLISRRPVRRQRRNVVVLSKTDTFSRAGNPQIVLHVQELKTGRHAITYVGKNDRNRDLLGHADHMEVGKCYSIIHRKSNGFSSFLEPIELADVPEDHLKVPHEATSKQTIMLFDIEIFKTLGLYVFQDYFTDEWFIFENDLEGLRNFYKTYRDSLFIGYNNGGYDNHILKAELQGKSRKEIFEMSQYIVKSDGNKTKLYSMYDTKAIPLFTMDLYMDNKGFSLKEHSGFLGLDIRETEVDFEQEEELTPDQRVKNIKYCKNDVKATRLRFEQNIGMLLAKVVLCGLHDLNKTAVGMTNANLTALILKAEKTPDRGDEFDEWKLPDNLQIEDQELLAEFTGVRFKKGDKGHAEIKFTSQRRDLEEKLGVGGIHGAIKKFIHIGRFIARDVGSLYPNTMILFALLSRNIPEEHKHLYKQTLDDRMNAKYSNEKVMTVKGIDIPMKTLIDGFKLPLNTKYGAMGAEFNKLFDARQRLLVCLVGQMAMWDLMEKIEPHATLFQSNTDAHYYLPFSEDDEQAIDKAADDWSERTGYTLDKDIFVGLYQKDVNNYLALEENGDVKVKGAVGLTHGLKISKAIVSNAFINYVIGGHDYREYIMNNNDLRQYQMITKTGYTFDDTIIVRPDGTIEKAQKVNRVFAVKDASQALEIKKVKDLVNGKEAQKKTKGNQQTASDIADLFKSTKSIDDSVESESQDDLDVNESSETTVEGTLSYTKGLANAPQYYTIDNREVGTGITIDEIDKEYYINEVERLLVQWFGKNWKTKLEEAHSQYETEGIKLPEITEYIN